MARLLHVTLIPRIPDLEGTNAKDRFLRQNPDVIYGDRNRDDFITNLIFYASDTKKWENKLCRRWKQFTVKEIEHGRQINFTNPNGEQKVNVNFYNTNITLVQGTEANLLEFYNTFENEDRRREVMEQAEIRQEDETSE